MFSDWLSAAQQTFEFLQSPVNNKPLGNSLNEFHLFPQWLDETPPWISQSIHPLIHSILDYWVLGQSPPFLPTLSSTLNDTIEREESYAMAIGSTAKAFNNQIKINSDGSSTTAKAFLSTESESPADDLFSTQQPYPINCAQSITSIGSLNGALVNDSFHGKKNFLDKLSHKILFLSFNDRLAAPSNNANNGFIIYYIFEDGIDVPL